MTKTKRKLQLRTKRAFKESVKARKRHQRAVKAYRKLVRQYRAA
jgi:hypothetical protein